MDLEPQSKQAIQEASAATSAVVAQAKTLEVTDPTSYGTASDLLNQVKAAQKLVQGKKDVVLKPLLEATKNYRDMFKPVEDEISQAESIIKGKILDYSRKARQAEERLQARVERGTMKTDTALRKLDEVSVSNTNKVQVRKVKKLRIVKLADVPSKYFGDPRVMEALQRAVRDDAFALFDKGINLPGVEVYYDETVAGS